MKSLQSFIGSWAGHLAGYVVSAAGIVSAIDPKLIPPQYSFVTALAGFVTIAAHNGYTAGKLNGAATAAANAAAAALKAAGGATAAMLLVGLLVLPGISGCSTAQLAKANATVTKVNGYLTSPAAQPIITAAALAAVTTAEQHHVTAAQITDIANRVLAASSSSTATLAGIGGVINAQLAALKLPPGDLQAVEIVEVSLGAAIQARIGSNGTLAQSQVAVADLARAVLDAVALQPAA